MGVLPKLVVIVATTHLIRGVAGFLGPRVGGVILGLPVSTAVVLFFLGADHGSEFAAAAASSGLLGLGAAVLFALTAAAVLGADRSLGTAIACGVVAYFAAAGACAAVGGRSVGVGVIGALLGILLATRLAGRVPTPTAPAGGSRLPWAYRIGLRTVIPVVVLLTVLELAGRFGPVWAGLCGTFPCTLLAVLTVTHREDGPRAAAATARGFIPANTAMVAFVGTVAVAAGTSGIGAAVALGYGAAVVVLLAQEGTRRLAGRGAGPAGPTSGRTVVLFRPSGAHHARANRARSREPKRGVAGP